jgi:hypothetical protein
MDAKGRKNMAAGTGNLLGPQVGRHIHGNRHGRDAMPLDLLENVRQGIRVPIDMGVGVNQHAASRKIA